MDSQKLQHIKVDPSQKISFVSMYVYTYSGELLRLKFSDNYGNVLVDHKFWDGHYSLCRWEKHEIPQDKEIIGVYCNTSSDTCYIKSLGFILWRPPFAFYSEDSKSKLEGS